MTVKERGDQRGSSGFGGFECTDALSITLVVGLGALRFRVPSARSLPFFPEDRGRQ